MRRPIRLLIVLALATPTPGWAQVAADSGQRVRVHYGARKQAIGILESLAGERLMIRDTARHRDVVIPRSDITLIERSLGHHRNFWESFLVTFVASTFTVGALMALTYSPCEGDFAGCLFAPESTDQAFVFGLAGGAVLGLPLGLLVGAARKTERWAPLTLPSASGGRFSVTPLLGSRVGLMGTFRFGSSSQ
jgi:hypothetical protein